MVHMPPPLAGWAAELQLSALPNDLALAVRQYLGRLHELSPEAAGSLGYSLAMDVSARLGTPVPPGVPVQVYLTAVLAERRTREQARLDTARPTSMPTPPPTNATDGPEPDWADNPFTPPS
jgi:hypothetical protein